MRCQACGEIRLDIKHYKLVVVVVVVVVIVVVVVAVVVVIVKKIPVQGPS